MNKNELKEGEIYTHDNGNIVKFEYLNKYGYACGKFFIGGNCDRFNNNLLNSTGAFTTFNLKEATPKEKHWLKTCIKLDKFVSKEEAMKSFPKEVIKVKPFDVLSFKGIGPHNQGLYNKEDSLYRFESSNSRHSLGNLLYLDSKVIINSVINEEGNIFMINDTITTIEGVNKGKSFTITGFRINKSETMICAITNVHSNGVGIDKIEHFIEIKKPIIIAESMKDMIILKSKGIDSIVLPQETLLEKAKRLYPVGTKFIPTMRCGKSFEISTGKFIENNNTIYSTNSDYTIFYKNKWAEIIEDVKVGDKFKFKQHYRGDFIIDNIEDSTDGKIIFYNQHEKYNKNHNRVSLKNIKIIK